MANQLFNIYLFDIRIKVVCRAKAPNGINKQPILFVCDLYVEIVHLVQHLYLFALFDLSRKNTRPVQQIGLLIPLKQHKIKHLHKQAPVF